jgi:hypothetical protein
LKIFLHLLQLGQSGLELVLGLAQELAGYEDARDKLAEGLKKYKTFSAFLVSINQEGEAKKKTLQVEISSLEGSRRQAEYILSQLRDAHSREENLLSQLQSQIAEKGDVVSFYHRHRNLQPLIEYLDNQGGIIFHHCIHLRRPLLDCPPRSEQHDCLQVSLVRKCVH